MKPAGRRMRGLDPVKECFVSCREGNCLLQVI